MTAYEESRIIREMTIACFFNSVSKWTFYSVQSWIFPRPNCVYFVVLQRLYFPHVYIQY